MSPEFQPQSSSEQHPYGFTENERLFDRVNHARFLEIIGDPDTTVLKATVDSNSFGEFLFIATKRGEGEQISHITFYGLGFHEYRERWITQEWAWYKGTPPRSAEPEIIPNEEALLLIADRQIEIASQVGNESQSSRGKLYEMLADLTDEDGALTELEDFGDLFNDDNLFS